MRGESTSTTTQPPPRRRTRTRWIIACTLALLAGVMLNYLVAWGRVWRHDYEEERAWAMSSPANYGSNKYPELRSLQLPLNWPMPMPERWPLKPDSAEFFEHPWRSSHVFTATRVGPDPHRIEYLCWVTIAGWPLSCARVVEARTVKADFNGRIIQSSEFLTTVFRPDRALPGCSEPPQLPISIIPIPFAINTLFYAAIVMACGLLTRRFIHARRRRAGLCPHCRYALAGLPANAPCPECGHATPAHP